MNNKMFFLMAALTFVCAYVSHEIQRAISGPYWSFYAIAAVCGLALHIADVLLMRSYIVRRAPELASLEEVTPGTQTWELTAGTGIVPKWVSFIGLVSIGFFVAIPFELIAWLFRTLDLT